MLTSRATWPRASQWSSAPALLFCLVVIFCATAQGVVVRPALAAPYTNDSLQEDFKVAWNEFHDLTKDDRKSKYRIYWQDLEKQFLAIYKKDSEGPIAPKALYYAGRVNEELGRRSYVDSDFRRAVDYFQRVASRFPKHSWTDDCLYRKALLELNYLGEEETAKEDLAYIVRNYPKGDMRPKAVSLLSQLSGGTVLSSMEDDSDPVAPAPLPEEVAEEVHEEPTPPKQTRVPDKQPDENVASVTAVAMERPKTKKNANGLNELNEVRHQSSDEYTRIVINADRKTPFRYQLLNPVPELNKPHRLYIDLEDTIMGPHVKRNVDIADGILRRVRIAQNQPTVTRVVLDFQDLQKYQIFALENPYRIIIDVSAPEGRPRQVLAKASESAPQKGSSNKSAEKAPAKESKEKVVVRPVSKPKPAVEPEVVAKAEVKKTVKRPVSEPVRKGALKPAEPPAPVQTKKEAPQERVASLEPQQPVGDYTPPPDSHKQAATLVEQLGLTVRTIMIDAGHGGKDPGAIGVGGVQEKNINLRFAKILGEKLEDKGFNVLYTRKDDTFIALEDRTAKANLEKADLFVSVHCNAIHLKKFSGMETYFLDLATSKDAVRVAARENSVSTNSISDLQVILSDLMLNSKLKESKDLANQVHSRILKDLRKTYKVNDHGVRSAPFYVLMGAKMPAILVELGYVTNANEAKRLQSDEYLQKQADGLVSGIMAYKRNIEKFASL